MSERRMIEDRRIHEGLRELVGHDAGIDLVDAVTRRLHDGDARGRTGEPEPIAPRAVALAPARGIQPRNLLQAALILLGAAVVFAVLSLQDEGGSAALDEAADPFRFRLLPEYEVDDLDSIAQMPVNTRRVMLTSVDDAVLKAFADFASKRAAPGLVDVSVRWSAWSEMRQLTDDKLTHLARLPHVEHLDFELAPSATGAGLAKLAALPRLSSLWLRGCLQTSEDLAALAALSNLRDLYIEWSDAEPVQPRPAGGIAFLARMPQLRSLSFGESWHLTAADLEVLERLPDLRQLEIEHCDGKRVEREGPQAIDGDQIGLTDDTLRMLSRIRTLDHLSIGGAHSYTAAGLRALQDLPNLRSLDISSSDLDLEQLLALPAGLEALDSRFQHLPAKAVARLSGLRSLKMTGCAWRPQDWDVLDPARLERLEITGLDDNIFPVAFLERCVHMRKLKLWGPSVRDEHFAAATSLTELVELDISSQELSDEHLAKLAGAQGLRVLKLAGHGLTPRADLLDSLAELPLQRIELPRPVYELGLLRMRIAELWPSAVLRVH